MLLAFHPSELHSSGGKLPLTIYESVYEGSEDAGRQMDIEGEEALKLRFRELPCSTETGEAEMISVDFVARGGGNATAITGTADTTQGMTGNEMEVETADETNVKGKGKGKGKGKDSSQGEEKPSQKELSTLSPEDDESK